VPLVEVDEASLIRPDLVHVHVVEPRIGEALDAREMSVAIGAADDSLRDIVL
jgi:hypothetical protein